MLYLPTLTISPHIVDLGSKEMAFFLGSHKDASIHLNISQDYLQNCKDYHDKWLLGDDDCYKNFRLYANVSYYHSNMPCLNSMYFGNNLENLQVLHINANPNATFSPNDTNDIGYKWLESIEKFIYDL